VGLTSPYLASLEYGQELILRVTGVAGLHAEGA